MLPCLMLVSWHASRPAHGVITHDPGSVIGIKTLGRGYQHRTVVIMSFPWILQTVHAFSLAFKAAGARKDKAPSPVCPDLETPVQAPWYADLATRNP